MIRIGLLSDTHGFIDDSMISFLSPVDEIWHAGDIGSLAVADALAAVKPLVAVYGNIDDARLRSEFPLWVSQQREGVKIAMTHIGGYPGKYASGVSQWLKNEKPGLFIAGHSHILKAIFDNKYQCLHLNPGAAGISGFHAVRTMMRFSIDGDKIKDLEIWEKPR